MIKYIIIRNSSLLNKGKIEEHFNSLSEDSLYHRFGYKQSRLVIHNYVNKLLTKLCIGVFAYDEEDENDTIIGVCIIEKIEKQKEISISVLDKYTTEHNNQKIAKIMLEIILNKCKENDISFDCFVDLKNKKAYHLFKHYLTLDKITEDFFVFSY